MLKCPYCKSENVISYQKNITQTNKYFIRFECVNCGKFNECTIDNYQNKILETDILLNKIKKQIESDLSQLPKEDFEYLIKKYNLNLK